MMFCVLSVITDKTKNEYDRSRCYCCVVRAVTLSRRVMLYSEMKVFRCLPDTYMYTRSLLQASCILKYRLLATDASGIPEELQSGCANLLSPKEIFNSRLFLFTTENSYRLHSQGHE